MTSSPPCLARSMALVSCMSFTHLAQASCCWSRSIVLRWLAYRTRLYGAEADPVDLTGRPAADTHFAAVPAGIAAPLRSLRFLRLQWVLQVSHSVSRSPGCRPPYPPARVHRTRGSSRHGSCFRRFWYRSADRVPLQLRCRLAALASLSLGGATASHARPLHG